MRNETAAGMPNGTQAFPARHSALCGTRSISETCPVMQQRRERQMGESGQTVPPSTPKSEKSPAQKIWSDRKKPEQSGLCSGWYAGRDSNPQPSEPESDALSIEPPARTDFSLFIIARFLPFVKSFFAGQQKTPRCLEKRSSWGKRGRPRSYPAGGCAAGRGGP